MNKNRIADTLGSEISLSELGLQLLQVDRPSFVDAAFEPPLLRNTIDLGAPAIANRHSIMLVTVLLFSIADFGGSGAGDCQGQDQALYSAGGLDPYAFPSEYGPSSTIPSTATYTATDPTVKSASHTFSSASSQRWCVDLLPEGLIYRPYLAGPKEPRTGIQFANVDDDWQFDSSIGGQWGLLRIGNQDPAFPLGWQLDIEGAAQFRHDSFASQDILTTDIRFGLPLTYSRNNHKTKLSVYFLRSDPSREFWDTIGAISDDEFFERKAIVLGHSIYLSEKFRIYGEGGYAFSSQVSDKWEFQFGAECAPVLQTGILGAPFLAANALLREEVDFGGIFTLQAGWAWRKRAGRLMRIGLQYANGKSNHFAIQDWHEQQVGFGIWFDP
ncbi:DUF1207 domain-containing protein [Stieleria sp. TO1_6]|uniref:DUF1207 domain-containing protein n=1 Tax=Stieleria tagensis TaxID=2956795 RepID=UPI00209AC92F|nr:DUF1207 domain-containing protein [Stieleria tagensis]MCO8123932.1 DUF1207 domain-containing protein [Stieleria tagensis]